MASNHVSTDVQRALLELYPPTRVFAVISWGAAATSWLATVLNSCPDIFCVHALNQIWRNFGGAKSIDGLTYLQMVGMQGHAVRVAGDVHGIDRSEVPAIREFFGDRFRVAVVIRDPLPRLCSQLALFEHWGGRYTYELDYLNAVCPDGLKLLPTGSYDEQLFLHGVNMINAITEEIAVGPIFRMEDLTSYASILTEFIQHVSGGDVIPSPGWAECQVRSRAINRHAHTASRAFLPWQRSVIKAVVKPDSTRIYREFGYDMSWTN